MKRAVKEYIRIEKNPHKGLFAFEWVVMAYLAVTLLMIFFAYTKLHNPESMIWGRMRVVAITASLWAVYRMVPCRLMVLARAVAQMALLSWWYPDTYELNRLLPNLDHVFATWEQQLFGCQPALLFCQQMPQHWFSELMDLGYASYFPMILVVMLFVFLFRYKDFQRTAWIVAGSFFLPLEPAGLLVGEVPESDRRGIAACARAVHVLDGIEALDVLPVLRGGPAAVAVHPAPHTGVHLRAHLQSQAVAETCARLELREIRAIGRRGSADDEAERLAVVPSA